MTCVRTDRLARELAELADASREMLVEGWQIAYGRPPTRGTRRELLVASAAWHLQKRRLGGLSRDAKRRLEREMAQVAPLSIGPEAREGIVEAGSIALTGRIPPVDQTDRVQTQAPAERRTILPGARLLRDWNGVTHAVDVVDGGYLYGGRLYRSLSAIAKTITGAHWSGPRFFAL